MVSSGCDILEDKCYVFIFFNSPSEKLLNVCVAPPLWKAYSHDICVCVHITNFRF
jgi:hypothetical protein